MALPRSSWTEDVAVVLPVASVLEGGEEWIETAVWLAGERPVVWHVENNLPCAGEGVAVSGGGGSSVHYVPGVGPVPK